MGTVHEHVHLASPDDGADVASILADGFRRDPVISWVLDDREQMHTFFASLVADPVLDAGGTYLSRDSCAVWTRPDHDPWTEGDLATRFTTTMRSALSQQAFERLTALNAATEQVHPRQPHWYLGMLATRQRSQGQGLGSAILKYSLSAVDREKQPAYLEATEPGNVRSTSASASPSWTRLRCHPVRRSHSCGARRCSDRSSNSGSCGNVTGSVAVPLMGPSLNARRRPTRPLMAAR